MLATTPKMNAHRLAKATRWAAALIAAAMMFGAIAFTAIELTRGGGRIAMVWVPNAIAVAALLHLRLREEVQIIAAMWCGNFAANLGAGDTSYAAGVLAAGNSVEILVTLLLSRRLIAPSPDMGRVDHLVRFCVIGGIIAPAISATIALAALGGIGSGGWLKWMATDGLGMVIVAPALSIFLHAVANPRFPTRREAYEWITLTAVGTSVTAAVFIQSQYPLLFLVPLVVLSHAFRLGSLGTAFSLLKVGIIATYCTYAGTGPIHLIDQTIQTQLVVLQVFLASAFLSGLPVAAALRKQRDTLAELEEKEAQLSLLADNMSDAVMQFDMEGICTYASGSVRSVLDQAPEAFIGKAANSGVHPDERENITQLQNRMLSGEVERERITYRRVVDAPDGSPVFMEANCALVRDPATGDARSVIVSYRDVTERVRLEQKLVRARRHAENAAVAKSQFLANMSHEIRTPMNGVLGFVDLLLESDLSPQQRQYAGLVRDSGHNMMLLLNDILDISKIEAGEIEINTEPLALRQLVENCTRLHSESARRKGVAMLCTVADNVPDAIVSDGLRLRQILLNLLGNAVKFTDEGGVELSVCREGQTLVIAVSDSGIGISEARLEAIFNPFEQAENSTSRQYGGTGLGLSISRRLAELLSGILTVESTPCEGSCFTIRMPLNEARHQPLENCGHETPLSANSVRRGARVLLAEDHDINRMLVSAMLERFSLDIQIVEDGQAAVTAVMAACAASEPFELVLMDVQMPKCDGYEATQTIRDLGISGDTLPIVALTANAFDDDIRAAYDAGMQGHLAKPLAFADLAGVLGRWLPDGSADGHSKGPTQDFDSSSISVAMEEKWQTRRKEALAAVSETLASGDWDGATLDQLARAVHKLAGTAGMFGEAELGERAKAFETALRDADALPEQRSVMARALLAAA